MATNSSVIYCDICSLSRFRPFADGGGTPGNHDGGGVAGEEADLPARHERHQGGQPHPHAGQERLQADANQGE